MQSCVQPTTSYRITPPRQGGTNQTDLEKHQGRQRKSQRTQPQLRGDIPSISIYPQNLALALALAAIALSLVAGRPLDAEELTKGCEWTHRASAVAQGIEQEKERDPIRFADDVDGSAICTRGWVSVIKWGTRPNEQTTVVFQSPGYAEGGVACRLARSDAAQIEDGKFAHVRGTITNRTIKAQDQRVPLLDACRITPRLDDDGDDKSRRSQSPRRTSGSSSSWQPPRSRPRWSSDPRCRPRRHWSS